MTFSATLIDVTSNATGDPKAIRSQRSTLSIDINGSAVCVIEGTADEIALSNPSSAYWGTLSTVTASGLYNFDYPIIYRATVGSLQSGRVNAVVRAFR